MIRTLSLTTILVALAAAVTPASAQSVSRAMPTAISMH
jgi:hypothetical protein